MEVAMSTENIPDEVATGVHVNSDEFGEETQRMMKFLNDRVIGQERAMRHIARSNAIYASGMADPGGAAGVFMFAGPTGVGKTETALSLARYLVADVPHAPIIRIQCGKYKEAHRVSELISSPPGYIGSDKVPFLDQLNVDAPHFWVKVEELLRRDEKLRRAVAASNPGALIRLLVKLYKDFKPYRSVWLFDEVEKAHPDLHAMLLHIIDDGEIVCGDGGSTKTQHSTIVLTCNVNGKQIQEILQGKERSLGFRQENPDVEKRAADIDKLIYLDTIERIEQVFAPELVGRLRNEIVVFRPLNEGHAKTILEGLLRKVQGRLDAKMQQLGKPKIALDFSDGVRAFLLANGFSRTYGVRPLKHTVRKFVSLRLANALDSGALVPGDTATFWILNGVPEIFRGERKPLTAPRRVYIPPASRREEGLDEDLEYDGDPEDDKK